MAERQLIIAVEGTAALGPFWPTILSEFLDKIIRSFCGSELAGQKLLGGNPELALVVFNTHGPYSAFVAQRSGWTKDMDVFLQWLSGLSFTGGGFSEAAIAEGLAEALTMFPATASILQSHQNPDAQKHCILVAASNPHPVPTPVYRPPVPNLEHTENAEAQAETCLADAETVAKSFGQYSISLSVISPKQLPTLRAIYTAGKRTPRAADSAMDNAKNSQFLVLLSENFIEARTAFSRPSIVNLTSNQTNAKLEVPPAAPISGPPSTAITSVNGPLMNRQPVPVGNLPTATVKVEPTTVPSIVSGPAFSNVTSVPNITSQGLSSLQASSPSPTSQEMNANNESVSEFKPPANVSILNTISQRRQRINNASIAGGNSIGLPTMGGTPMTIHMSNMISSGMVSSAMSGITSLPGSGTLGSAQVAQSTGLGSFGSTTPSMAGTSSIGISPSLANLQGNINITQSVPGMGAGQGGMPSGGQIGQGGISMNQNIINGLGPSGMSSVPGTMIPTPGMPQQTGVHSLGITNNSSVNMPLGQHASGVPQSQSKYVKIWEGNLSGQRQGQPVFICKLEGYRSQTASEALAADWPATMQIVRLISQDHMNNKQYVGKADFLVFRTLNQHGFLAQLQEKKLCAVIQLPSQTLLLSVSDKASRLIGMLFPGDMVVFKPQVSSQQQQQQTHQQLQQQQQQQLQQQQLQQAQQHQQMMGSGMNQSFVQGTARSQIMPQGKMPQGHGSMSGGGFLP